MTDNWKEDAGLQVARLMAAAAVTAPKARGIDNLVVKILQGDEIKQLAQAMRDNAPEAWPFFHRDAANVEDSQALVLIGTRLSPLGLDCGYCGFPSCEECKGMKGICTFNPGDLGIALGSAASVAARHHIDNRIMFSAGWTAVKTDLLGADVRIAHAIPLSISGKNIFFDRKA